MGKNSQARRATRAKARAQHRARTAHQRQGAGEEDRRASPLGDPTARPQRRPAPEDPAIEAARHWTELLQMTEILGPTRTSPRIVDALARLPASSVDAFGELLVDDQVGVLLQHGWQPAEVHRIARRHHASSARLVAECLRRHLAEHLSTHPDDSVDPRWQAQVDELGGPRSRSRWYSAWQHEDDLDRPTAYATTAALLVRLGQLPALRPLVPPPGSTATRHPSGSSDPVLQKVRGLLAKAESTEFEAEAAALTAKAQELMTRHAIDQAALHAQEPVGTPSTIRVPIDPPYVDPKSLLLQTVAQATRCRTVFLTGVDLSEVVGYPEDLAAVELLFTSLLVQAQKALSEAGRRSGAGGRARSQGFRAAFLRAYAHRIGERLAEANDHVMAGTQEDSARYLPVLRSREEAIDHHIDREYGTLSRSSVRGGYDPAGAASGRLAADQAELTSGHLPS